MHTVPPDWVLNVPGAQRLHVVAPPVLYLPAAHDTGGEVLSWQAEPAGQGRQAAAPGAVLYCPGLQSLQGTTPDPPGLNFPAGHTIWVSTFAKQGERRREGRVGQGDEEDGKEGGAGLRGRGRE